MRPRARAAAAARRARGRLPRTMVTSSLLLLLGGSSQSAAHSNAAAATSVAAAAAAALPCGAPPTPLNQTTPNVLIVGDSISMGFGVSATDTGYGYGLNVAKMLAGPFAQFYSKDVAGGLATVQHAGGFGINGGSSQEGVACIGKWLGPYRWDVVTVNFGLHDCDPGDLNRSVYVDNVRTVLMRARAAARRVIFVTTTPFFTYKQYSMSCVIRSNAAAQKLVAQMNQDRAAHSDIAVADLFGYVNAYCGANYTQCPIQLRNNLHFSTAWTPPFSVDKVSGKPLQAGPAPSGQQYTGLLVARAIQRALPASKIRPPINISASDAASTHQSRPQLRATGACGLPPLPLNKSLPNVLVIGDSVSDSGSGYGPDLRRLLETSTGNSNSPRNNGPLAQVQHNGGWACQKPPFKPVRSCQPGASEQAGPTTTGVQCIDSWLGGEKRWDVISFNWGIHDCWARQYVNATQYRLRSISIPTAILTWLTSTTS
jgi:hypothetical protein